MKTAGESWRLLFAKRFWTQTSRSERPAVGSPNVSVPRVAQVGRRSARILGEGSNDTVRCGALTCRE